MKTRGRAWRRYKNDTKTIRNMKARYRWTWEPAENIEENAELSWYQTINSSNWNQSKQKTKSIDWKDGWYHGDYPIKKYYRPKVKELNNNEVKEFYREICQ